MLTALRRLFRTTAPEVAIPAATPPPIYGVWPAPDGWIERRRARAFTYAGLDDAAVAAARALAPSQAEAVMRAAERALHHEFDLLGSGPFVPIDPDRPVRGEYQPIDWYLDPVRKLRFPRGVPHKAWNLYEMRPGNADVKYPWELARCQHWVTLGQAWRLTGDGRFAREIVDQLDDFVEANPVGIGVNWTCTMDVALRVVSWVMALDLVRDCEEIDEAARVRAYTALFDHGVFIRGNLENTYEVTSNHFLSNVLGLWFLAAAFEDLPEGQAWGAFAREALGTEIDVQVLPDGADFESSVPYHRLVAELFLGAARLADYREQPLSDHYRGRVRDMMEYLASVLRPDGLMPQSGDADDGRLHVLGGTGTETPQDARHLLGPASVMFAEPAWMRMGGEAAAWEAAWWGVGVPASVQTGALPPVVRLFPDAGHAVVRDGGTYLLVTNSIVGTEGFGNHKHHDQLSFEYHLGGQPFIVDPGSFVYTSDPDARNLFRGTGYHNTLQVDAVEQHEMNPEWLFRLFEQGRAEHLDFGERDGWVEYRGRHHGYTRLPTPLVHERLFRVERRTGRLEVQDRLIGEGRHRVEWHFHLAPGVDARVEPGGCRLSHRGVSCTLTWPEDLQPVLVDAWYSPSYGVRHECRGLNLSADIQASDDTIWRFSIVSEGMNA